VYISDPDPISLSLYTTKVAADQTELCHFGLMWSSFCSPISMAAAGGSSKGETSTGKPIDVDALLRNLWIREEDFDDLIIDNEATMRRSPAWLLSPVF
jgi:hypothetical protein